MISNSREDILKRIRIGLHRLAIVRGGNEYISKASSSYKETQQKLEIIRRNMIEKKSFLLDMFMNEVTKVNGNVFIVKSEDEIKHYVTRLVEEHDAKSLAIWESGFLKQINLREFLEIKGLGFVSPYSKEQMAEADIGITEGDFCIAETGTIVLITNERQPRSISLIPPVHIAIVKSDEIIENSKDLFFLLANTVGESGSLKNLTSCITFITGPSRTGDIELSITLGVHGPKELHIIIYDS
ncbi:MAG: lactate utilization protein [Candidatus Dadabacteria bacterium]|nr:lactate utilization protein [Candidatus Dadabacteria bacterium]